MLRPVHDVENVTSDAAFWVALVLGGTATAIVWFRVRRGREEPGIMVVLTAASVIGLQVNFDLPAALVVGLALLFVGEWLTRDEPRIARAIATSPGALVLGAALPDGWPFWIRTVVSVSAVVGGLLVQDADRALPRPTPLLLAIGALGVYLCVPDTEAPKALLGALLAGAVIGLVPRLRATLGAPMVTGLFVWVVGVGGLGRPGSVVGGIACLGVLVLIRVVRWTATAPARVTALVVTQCALVVFVARVAGFEESGWSAAVLCLPAFAAAALALVLVGQDRGRRASRS
jgi:hypothetical protein